MRYMADLADSLHWIAVTLWTGALWAIGFIAAPLIFVTLEDRALALMLAGKMFAVVAYIGMGCGAYLILFRIIRQGVISFRQSFFWVVMVMLLLTLLGQFGAQPVLDLAKNWTQTRQVVESILQDRFATWHGVYSALYVVQSVLALVLVVQQPTAAP
ncbi:MAG TPA: DUF4149 domain-containing protein [Burkholderiales bacterium]|nr:DUF4149 domain-containing protein [Burkholderiales bacterium]